MKGLENVLNRLLARDPETLERLSRLSGKVVRLELLNTSQPDTSLLIEESGIRIETGYSGAADVLVRSTPLNLLAYLRSSAAGGDNPGGSLGGNLEIRGDLGLAQELQGILRGFEFDAEEQLARLLGDTLARKAGGLARAGGEFLRQLRHKLELDLGEYARYESETLPDGDEVERFNQAIDTLRDDVERLQRRLDKLSGVIRC